MCYKHTWWASQCLENFASNLRLWSSQLSLAVGFRLNQKIQTNHIKKIRCVDHCRIINFQNFLICKIMANIESSTVIALQYDSKWLSHQIQLSWPDKHQNCTIAFLVFECFYFGIKNDITIKTFNGTILNGHGSMWAIYKS